MPKTFQGLDEKLLGRRYPGSPRERLRFIDTLAEQRYIAEQRDEAFSLWCENLPEDKRAEYGNGVPSMKHRTHLRNVFDKESL